MDLEYTISTHSSLFILCCQGHRKPLHLPLHLTPSPSWAFVLAPSIRVATSPSPPRERAGEARVNVSQGCCCERLIWETEWMRVYCQTVIQLVCSSSKPSQNINCFHHIKAVLSYCWHMAWKSRLWFVLERWKIEHNGYLKWVEKLFWSWIYQWQYREKKAKPCYYNLWSLNVTNGGAGKGIELRLACVSSGVKLRTSTTSSHRKSKTWALFSTGVTITLGSSHKWLEEI